MNKQQHHQHYLGFSIHVIYPHPLPIITASNITTPPSVILAAGACKSSIHDMLITTAIHFHRERVRQDSVN